LEKKKGINAGSARHSSCERKKKGGNAWPFPREARQFQGKGGKEENEKRAVLGGKKKRGALDPVHKKKPSEGRRKVGGAG